MSNARALELLDQAYDLMREATREVESVEDGTAILDVASTMFHGVQFRIANAEFKRQHTGTPKVVRDSDDSFLSSHLMIIPVG